ncbi:AraC family transcriptional regulator [Paenibacillus sp. MY03]|uniref:AraC family transcriptional regulator n=1 Tax=Paenibacillus sp. MY03 TaxID=302980 RepID=UPI000B3D3E58|nr:AraC family transcriptional regulator [Paenibacillus sp. MY03]
MNRIDMAYWEPEQTIDHLNDYFAPPYITLAHLFHAPDRWEKKTGHHKQYQIQYVCRGTAIYEIEGNAYTTNQGDLIIHRPYENHSVATVPGQPYSCISIVFHFGDRRLPSEELYGNMHRFGPFSDHPIDDWLQQIVMHYHQPGVLHQMECQRLLLHTLAEAAKSFKLNNLSPIQRKNAATLMHVKNEIQNRYNEDIRLKELEQVSGLSRNYLCKLFKEEFGLLPMAYLTWLRIQKAKELAVQSNLSIGEIAEKVGYADVHTFGKMFKKKTGMSLSRYCSTYYMTEGSRSQLP